MTSLLRVRGAFQLWRDSSPVRRTLAVGGALGAIAGLVGTVGNIERMPVQLCRLPGIHSLCGWAEIGNVAGEREEALWQNASLVPDATRLREYLRQYPDGVYVEKARARLAACAPRQVEEWNAELRRLPLFVAPAVAPGKTHDETTLAANRRALEEARAVCAGFTGEFRVRGARIDPAGAQCVAGRDSLVCGFDGVAVCELEVRRLHAVEQCR
jgi:hypothetical protein